MIVGGKRTVVVAKTLLKLVCRLQASCPVEVGPHQRRILWPTRQRRKHYRRVFAAKSWPPRYASTRAVSSVPTEIGSRTLSPEFFIAYRYDVDTNWTLKHVYWADIGSYHRTLSDESWRLMCRNMARKTSPWAISVNPLG